MAAHNSASMAHTLLRLLQIFTLIPAWAIMAAVVAWYNQNHVSIPGGILCLFIVTLLACVWAFIILIATVRARNTALWIALGDLILMGALIAGVATTATIANYQCNAVSINTDNVVYITPSGATIREGTGDGSLWDDPNNCNLIKGAWGLAISNVVMFFFSAVLAVIVYQKTKEWMRDLVVVEEPREKIVYVDPGRPRPAHRSHKSSRTSRSSRTRSGSGRSGSRSYVYDDPL